MFGDSCYFVTVWLDGEPMSIAVRRLEFIEFYEKFQERIGVIPRVLSLVPITEEEFEDITNDWDFHYVYDGEQ